MSRLQMTLAAIGGVAYLLLGYVASSTTHPPLLAVLVALAPVFVGLIAGCWRTRLRIPATLIIAAGIVVLVQHAEWMTRYAANFFFLQHVGAMAGLGIMFGGTLGSREGALCSRIARFAIPAPLDAQYIEYTWKVTLAWTVYFFLFAAVSIGLFCFAALQVWSVFATFITPLSVGAMFAGEYLVRAKALPGRPHFSIAQTVRSYREYTRQS